MKSAIYTRRTLKGFLLLFGCCLLYLLSTGPAMMLMLNVESDSAEETVQIYLTPLMKIEHVLSLQFNNDPFSEGTFFQKTLVRYLELYGEETALVYQVMYWKHSIISGHTTPTGSCVF